MYNRYIRNDTGSYIRIPQEEQEPSHHSQTPPTPQPGKSQSYKAPSPPPKSPPRTADTIAELLRNFLDRLHLNHVDTGDLLLLGLLFFLFREDADEELLVALGLLLIL